jgi:hypothetical protein
MNIWKLPFYLNTQIPYGIRLLFYTSSKTQKHGELTSDSIMDKSIFGM